MLQLLARSRGIPYFSPGAEEIRRELEQVITESVCYYASRASKEEVEREGSMITNALI